MTNPNLTFTRGDTDTVPITITQDGTAMDITNYTITLTVKDANSYIDDTDDSDALYQVTAIPTLAISGMANFVLTASGLEQDPGIYKYDIQISSGIAFIKTLVKGKFIIEADVTRTIPN